MVQDRMRVRAEDAVVVQSAALREQIAAIFVARGVPEDHARTVAEILVAADLRGVDSHGAINVVRYVTDIDTGNYTIPQALEVVVDSPAIAVLDNGDGFGFVGAHRAMSMAIEKAREVGIGQVALRRGHHIGMAAYYPMMAAEQDMIGMCVTNSTPHMRPVGGLGAKVGTNPIAFAAPAGEERPFVLDMATTTVANGKIRVAHRLGLPLPEGWAVTAEDGTPVLEAPEKAADWWTLEPLGGTLPLGGHKGYGLGVMVDILAGLLSGGGFSRELPTGHNQAWFMAIDIGRFRPIDEFKAHMDAMIRELHSTPPAPGSERVLVAGDPEAETYERRSREGIPLQRKLVEEIRAKAEELGAPISI
ncbi:MAG: Ldh family oxidoreductase [Dehalococcoidia bacterium]|nr:Ldh family oxidoreductase [Dehalococcoidia bacterium]